jgi:hypothetical protein
MNRLQSECRRLYLPHAPKEPCADSGESGLIDSDGRVRAMVLELAGPSDWEVVARVWRGVQVDLDLPAPAIAVSGIDGYQLWFSLLDPLPVAQAHAFLDALRVRYLGDIARERLRLLPTAGPAPWHAGAVPAQQAQSGYWSAYVAPDLAPMFVETPWLDIPPGMDGQADLLSSLQSIQRADLQKALEDLRPAATPMACTSASVSFGTPDADAGTMETGRASTGACTDPKRFLLDVMNNHTVELGLRIEAAKALLPYFGDRPRR